MNNILINQNKKENIQRLAAQRQLYKTAKNILVLQIILTVPVTIFFSLLKLIPETAVGFNIAAFAAVYGILLALIDLFVFNHFINLHRTDAAKVQELFDCDVYEMDWNNVFVGKKPQQETVNTFARKYVDVPGSPLSDWYPIEIAQMPREMAILTCQKTNLYYDSSLRKKYKNLSILISLSTHITLQSFIVQILAPFLPVFILTSKIIIDHSKAIKSASEFHQSLDSVVDPHNLPSIDRLRAVQDKIYCHRKDSPLIPDFFYDKKRANLETEMHENASVKKD